MTNQQQEGAPTLAEVAAAYLNTIQRKAALADRLAEALAKVLRVAGPCTPYRLMGREVCQHGYSPKACPIPESWAALQSLEEKSRG